MNKRGTLQGLGKVYNFTLVQLFKNKANIVSFGIMILLAMAAPPIMILLAGGGAEETGTMFYSQVLSMDEYLNGSSVDYDTRYGIQFGYSIIVMFTGVFSCTYIIRAIVEEKTSKLVETLMVSIKSQDMILGKILAVMTFIFSMLILVVIGFFMSSYVTAMFVDPGAMAQVVAESGIDVGALRLDPSIVLVVLISLILAYFQFALIAGLSGAGCTSMEDVEPANTSSMLVIMAGYMVTGFSVIPENPPAVFLSLCPVISPYTAPAYYAMGEINTLVLIISWLIQGVCIFATLKLSGKVYDSLIMYRGKRLKMRQIFAMANNKRREER